ncbi:putative methyltransferase DDB_G0268948 [Pagrus major]|uniref:putative methyltransferase DDB_G0268948 n=1 Tax=Pagrus major TaxID=143350 RepID=UPI003CC83D25
MALRLYEGKAHAAGYLKNRVIPHEVISRMINYMKKKAPNEFDLAVDVGCGSGQVTIPLAAYFTKVVGTDNSAAQLEMALINSNPPNVSYRQCSAEELPFASGEVDLVMSMSAAHLFDRPKFLVEADRVLRPGGCLAVGCHTTDAELEYGDVSNELNDICNEFYAALSPFRPNGELSYAKKYLEIFESCSYPDQEWTECFRIKRTMPLTGYIGMVESYSSYQCLVRKDPAEAERLSTNIRNKLLSAMKASSADTEVTVVVKFFYGLACKPC